MSLILNIDASSAQANVSLSRDGLLLNSVLNNDQREHASFIQPAIKKMLAEADLQLQNVDAIAVINGPGSYTGLRVALASAKGLAYVLGKPLITISTLEVMALSALPGPPNYGSFDLVCPMMDARRLEVFTAVFDLTLHEVLPPQAMILTHDSYETVLSERKVLFFGSGAAKWQTMTSHANALFATGFDTVQAMANLSLARYESKIFTDIVYSEPLYLKEFYMAKG